MDGHVGLVSMCGGILRVASVLPSGGCKTSGTVAEKVLLLNAESRSLHVYSFLYLLGYIPAASIAQMQ